MFPRQPSTASVTGAAPESELPVMPCATNALHDADAPSVVPTWIDQHHDTIGSTLLASSGSPCPMSVESHPASIGSSSGPTVGSPIGHTADLEPKSGSMIRQSIADVGPSSGLLDGTIDMSSTQLPQHSMITRSKSGISKPNPK